jgi:hypothetical protein
MHERGLKLFIFAVIGMSVALNGCATKKIKTASVQNTVYVLELVKDIPTGRVFSFRDYCIFNAERGSQDSFLDKTLAQAGVRLELHFFSGTAALKLVSSNGDKSAAFLEYQKQYASEFFFTESQDTVELTLNIETLDEEMQVALKEMSVAEREAVFKSVFEKSKDMLIEPDEEDNVINYWKRLR